MCYREDAAAAAYRYWWRSTLMAIFTMGCCTESSPPVSNDDLKNIQN